MIKRVRKVIALIGIFLVGVAGKINAAEMIVDSKMNEAFKPSPMIIMLRVIKLFIGPLIIILGIIVLIINIYKLNKIKKINSKNKIDNFEDLMKKYDKNIICLIIMLSLLAFTWLIASSMLEPSYDIPPEFKL